MEYNLERFLENMGSGDLENSLLCSSITDPSLSEGI